MKTNKPTVYKNGYCYTEQKNRKVVCHKDFNHPFCEVCISDEVSIVTPDPRQPLHIGQEALKG